MARAARSRVSGSKTKASSVAHSIKGHALSNLNGIKDQIIPKLMERIDMEAAAELPRENLWHEIAADHFGNSG